MSDYSEQLHLDFNQDPESVDSVSGDTRSPLEKLLDAHNTTEERLDTLADSLGSYSDAYRQLGISRDEIDALNHDDALSKPTKNEVKTSYSPVNVALSERAIHLLAADRARSKYFQASGFEKALNSPYKETILSRYDDEKSYKIVASQQSYADKVILEVSKAFGREAMRMGGEEPSEEEIKAAGYDYLNSNVGPENKSARAKLRKTWKRQLKKPRRKS